MKLYVEPMDAFVIEVGADGRVRLENEDWTEPTLQEKRAIIYAAEEELSALTELLADFTGHIRLIRSALEGRDFAKLGDLLADKMSRVVQQWREAIRSFRGVILV